MWRVLLSLVLLAQQPETMSLLDKPLYAPRLPREERAARESALVEARAAYEHDPVSVDAAIALARAEMAIGRVGDALEIITRAQEGKPDDPRLALERARGLITIRKFELAVKALAKPAETLPDARCALGLAQYLAASYARAREALAKCPEPGIFAYLADARAGSSGTPRPVVTREPTRDRSVIRLPGAATPGPSMRLPLEAMYLDAVERFIKGDTAGARALLKQIVEKDRDRWTDPVYIAAEVDYAAILKSEGKRPKKDKQQPAGPARRASAIARERVFRSREGASNRYRSR